jgi:hypothetical protein
MLFPFWELLGEGLETKGESKEGVCIVEEEDL